MYDATKFVKWAKGCCKDLTFTYWTTCKHSRKCSNNVWISIWLISESREMVEILLKPPPLPLHKPPPPPLSVPLLSAPAQWPLPLLEQSWPVCSSDPQCYSQTTSQWKMPPHFLGFTNTVWNKKPLSDLCIIHRVNWRENKCIVHLNGAVKTR